MKTDHGTIAMWKTSIILVIGLGFLLYTIVSYSGTSKDYWESVGPSWDKMLNPCNYTECVIK